MTLGVGGDRAEASRRTVDIFKRMIKAYAGQLDEPYEFPSYHTSMREPFDYYQLGNDYVGAMIDWDRSVVRWPACLKSSRRREFVLFWSSVALESPPGGPSRPVAACRQAGSASPRTARSRVYALP